MHGLSNGGLSHESKEWAKVTQGKAAFEEILAQNSTIDKTEMNIFSDKLLLNNYKPTGCSIFEGFRNKVYRERIATMQANTNMPFWAEWVNSGIHVMNNTTGFATVSSTALIVK